ncbi:phosphoadenosine phosphosulfate reductase, partial [Planctomycetota bacterium]|nr:phosphoadenosine phosphosulfate reductase [Planctomycetota bacterium]
EELRTYGLPQHPLAHQGYASIGCGPCTAPSNADERDGRWAGKSKTECGLHLSASGKLTREAGASHDK